MPKFAKHFFFVLFSFCFAFVAQASGDYQVEVIIFKNLESTTQLNSYESNSNNVFTEEPLVAKTPSFAKSWPLENALLEDAANNIAGNPEQYQIISHSSWGQASAPFKKSAAVEFNSLGLKGYIKVFASDLLFAEIDLSFEESHLSERRRLKLNEVHYFDNAGFGILLQVSRWSQPETAAEQIIIE